MTRFKIAFLMLILILASCENEDKEYIFVNNNDTEVKSDIRPDFLRAGDKVAICAASNMVTHEELAAGIDTLKSWGLEVVEAPNLYLSDGRYAGNDKERTDGMQQMIDDPTIKAIFMARGGYGATRIIDKLNFTPISYFPKWIIGYSDVTAIHNALSNIGIESIHGTMIYEYAKTDKDYKHNVASLKSALFGELRQTTIPTNKYCIEGEAEGRIVGGNLSLIYSLNGTAFDLKTKNSILFIEEVGENGYSVDRMITSIILTGKTNVIKGIIIGHLKDITPDYGISKEEIIYNKIKNLGIPVIFGIECGHGEQNESLYLGRKIHMSVGAEQSSFTYL